ncbi:hypothetical protein CP981_23030 [Streptomyces platensis]|uniref:Uncharacterized protein n=1 Tax=Streptomyces platensis TaxID=58346 RepID=A0AAE6NJ73_STRPT|nr:hypothetical protein [Streptomyces platensis]OSY40492.1 hypothetical protein BG653_05393 [Streptomyces platensis]QEV54129.1 hypothetical protein CP981_23030 [Streptomyces platensis]
MHSSTPVAARVEGDKRLEGAPDRDRDGWLRTAANLTASADLNEATVQVYEELIGAEPALADEHRVGAAERRGYAEENRRFAQLALKRAGKL